MQLTLDGIRLINTANVREHWAKRWRRNQAQKKAAYRAASDAMVHIWAKLPARIRIVRIGKRKMDSDGLAISAKAVRDGIADAYGVDDGSELYCWEYAQEIGKEYAVRVELESV